MHFLCVNQTYWPDGAATAQYLDDLTRELLQRGHAVTVLCGRRSYLDPRVLYPRDEEHQGVRIQRVWTPRLPATQVRSMRMVEALLCNIILFFRILVVRKVDRIVVLTSPPMVAWFAGWAAHLKGCPISGWIMDLNPSQVFAAEWLREGGLLGRLLKAMQAQSLQLMTAVVTLDEYIKRHLLALGGIAADDVEVVPLWSDMITDTRDSASMAQSATNEFFDFRSQWNLHDKFVVMYAGNHSLCHPLTTVLEAARCLQDEQQIYFVFVGGGARVTEVSDYVRTHALKNVAQFEYQSGPLVDDMLQTADLHVVSMGEPFVGIVHPSKFYRILKAGRPFLYTGPVDSAIGKLLEEQNLLWQCDHEDIASATSIIRAISGLSAEDRTATELRCKALAATFKRSRLVDRLIQIFSRNPAKKEVSRNAHY